MTTRAFDPQLQLCAQGFPIIIIGADRHSTSAGDGAGESLDDSIFNRGGFTHAAARSNHGRGQGLQEQASSGTSQRAGKGVADQAEAMFLGNCRGSMAPKNAGDDLNTGCVVVHVIVISLPEAWHCSPGQNWSATRVALTHIDSLVDARCFERPPSPASPVGTRPAR